MTSLTLQATVGRQEVSLEDTRKRRHRYRLRFYVATLAAIIIPVLVLAGGGLGTTGGRAHGAEGRPPIQLGGGHISVDGKPITVSLSLARTSGADATAWIRWFGGFSIDSRVPASGARVLVAWSLVPRGRTTPGLIIVAIVGPGVAAIRMAHAGTFTTHHVNGLPRGYGASAFYYPGFPSEAAMGVGRTLPNFGRVSRRRERLLEDLPRLNPLSAKGAPIGAPTPIY